MEPTPTHSLPELFRQLGLPDGEAEIEEFIATHRPLGDGVALPEAPFWTPNQAQFLREEVLEDADWAPTIDTLNALLVSKADPRGG